MTSIDGSALRTIRHLALAALALALPALARAKPVGSYSAIVALPGDQTDPSVSGEWVLFSSATGDGSDVFARHIGAAPDAPPLLIAGGAGDQHEPDLSGAILAYRGPEGVFVHAWTPPDLLSAVRTPGQPGDACGPGAPESQPAVGASVVAWQCGAAGSRAVAVLEREGGTWLPEYRLVRPGEQLAPAAFGSLVAFIDAADGRSVWLHESAGAGATTLVCPGEATGVSIGSADGRTVVAATRTTPRGDADVEVWEPGVLVTALRVPGEQRNPHLSGPWVAFEDLSTGRSQVVLWQWTTGLVFLPHASATVQTLNDLDTADGQVRAVFVEEAEDGPTGEDVSLYRLQLDASGNVLDDGTGNPWPWEPEPPSGRPPPASCDSPDALELARLTLTRGRGTPRAESVDLATVPFGDDEVLPVLVCVESNGIRAGWMTFDDEAIASPRDFGSDRVRLAIPAVATDDTARLAVVVAGKPGSSLTVRVLADPGRPPPDCAGEDEGGEDEKVDSGKEWDHDLDGDHDQGFGNAEWRRVDAERFDRRVCGARLVPQPKGARGCSSGGPGGAVALLTIVLFAARLTRRR